MNHIPFNRPFIVGKELYYIAQAVQGGHLAGDGAFTKKCQEWMEQKKRLCVLCASKERSEWAVKKEVIQPSTVYILKFRI